MTMEKGLSTGEIIIYESLEGQLEIQVKLQDDTVWLTQKQIAEVFGVNVPAISKHMKNIFDSGELSKNSTISKMETVQNEGGRKITRQIEYFNLDLIISVGYRVNSARATQFRIWANKILKDYLIKGYAVNQKVLENYQEKFKEFKEVVSFINDKKKFRELSGQAEELIEIINSYSKSVEILAKYDEGKLELKGKQKPEFVLTYEDAQKFIGKIAEKIANYQSISSLFGAERGDQFKVILGSLYQTFGGEDLYDSVEIKAANLLYLTIKDHPFSDGNKRVGSLLFIYFLERNNYLFKESGERKIADNTLAALALLIATSNPKEKETMVKIVTNLL